MVRGVLPRLGFQMLFIYHKSWIDNCTQQSMTAFISKDIKKINIYKEIIFMYDSLIKQILRSFIFLTMIFSVSNLFAATEPDNSKVNERIENNNELSSQDQGSSEVDIKLTQKIRQDVVKQEAFSTEAQNIKIITIGGKVTLKGPVKTMEEKNRINSIAVKIAGVKNVTNEITVIK